MSQHQSNTPNRPSGRQFFFNPGPTHIPDSVLGAMHRPTIDFMAPEFKQVLERVHARTKRVLKTEQHLLYYGTNGHGAWEGSLANVFSPGDKVLMLESGHFSINWAQMARELGLEVEVLPADWRLGVISGALEERMRQDTRPCHQRGYGRPQRDRNRACASDCRHPGRDECGRAPGVAAGRYDFFFGVI